MRLSLAVRAVAALSVATVPAIALSSVISTASPAFRRPTTVELTNAILPVRTLLAAPAASTAAPVTAPELPSGKVAAVPYGPLAHQVLDLYLPDRTAHPGPAPVIVYLHSGGWVAGSRDNVNDAAAAQVARGYAVASIDYQLASLGGGGSFPAPVYDVKRAIRFLKADATTWGLDPGRVIVMGASAGGHLAALTGASAGRLEPDLTGPLGAIDSTVIGVVDLVGITDLATFATTPGPWAAPLTAGFLGCPLDQGRAVCPANLLREASVAPYVSAASPPIFMAYGGADTLVVPATQGAPLAHTWAAAHPGDPQSVTYQVVPGAGHNLGAGSLDMAALDSFLDRVSSKEG